jgi:hypothetical protein
VFERCLIWTYEISLKVFGLAGLDYMFDHMNLTPGASVG